jgi:hypothetical protein
MLHKQLGCTQEEKGSIIKDMETMVRVLPPTEKINIGANTNGHVVTTAKGNEGVHDGHGYDDRNDEGSRRLELAEELDLVIANTCLKRQDEHLNTYCSGLHASQIDYLLLKQLNRQVKSFRMAESHQRRQPSSSIMFL